jgi:hypothetical protein
MTPPRTIEAPVAEPPRVRPAHGIIRLINRVRVELIDAMDRELSKFDISAPQLIVLASVAFDAGIVNARFYTALVLLAIVTSQAAGAWLEFVLRRGRLLLAAQEVPAATASPEPQVAA